MVSVEKILYEAGPLVGLFTILFVMQVINEGGHYRLAWQLHVRGARRAAIDLAKLFRDLPVPWTSSLHHLIVRANVLSDMGETAHAVEDVRAALKRTSRDECAFWLVNLAVCDFVNDEALTLLSDAEPLAQAYPLAKNGLLCMQAWILAHTGALKAAREAAKAVDPRSLKLYRAEVFYTRAAIERDSGNVDRAFELATTGLSYAKRASSERNGLFMLAGILLARGDFDQARRRGGQSS